MAPLLPKTKLVSGLPDQDDLGTSTWALHLCPKGTATPQTAGYDSNYLAPVRRSHNSFSQAERIVDMNTIQGAEMSDQEDLERFFHVPVTHVDVCCSGPCNMTGGTQKSASGLDPRWNV